MGRYLSDKRVACFFTQLIKTRSGADDDAAFYHTIKCEKVQ